MIKKLENFFLSSLSHFSQNTNLASIFTSLKGRNALQHERVET